MSDVVLVPSGNFDNFDDNSEEMISWKLMFAWAQPLGDALIVVQW